MEKLNFRTRSRVIRTLGDRLISGENAAVIELVKNSYDADASFCEVIINPREDTIIVRDDGHGMTVYDVVNKWAELGTENKSNNKLSPKRRKVLGEKGIGRLAASKLGNKLEIISTSADKKELRTVKIGGIDWSLFLEHEEAYLENIDFYYEKMSPQSSIGTLLTISEIETTWTKEKLEILIVELRKLLSPLQENDDLFKIYLNLEAFTKPDNDFDGSGLVNGGKDLLSGLNKGISENNRITPFPLLDACDYKFTGEFEGNVIKGVFYISEEHREYPIDITLNGNDVSCGFGLVYLNIFDRDADSVRNTFVKAGLYEKNEKSSIPLRDARKAIDDMSGIAVYRENFRIRPYGDQDADWLSLDKRRVQNPSLRIEQAQVSGTILIDSAESSGLIELSSREGFEINDNYDFFKKILLTIFSQIEPLRRAYKDKTGKNRISEQDKSKHIFGRLHDEVSLKELEEVSSQLPKEDAEKVSQAIEQHKTKLEHLIESIQERQSLLEARSTLGFIIAEVIHEARHPTSAIGSDLKYLKNKVSKKWSDELSDSIKGELVGQLGEDIEHVLRLESLYNRMDPFLRIRRKRPQEYELTSTLNKSLLLFKERIKKEKIIIEHVVNNEIFLKGVEEDVLTATTNVLDNALYWLSARETPSPTIRITYHNTNDAILIYMSDNASGISGNYKDSIFNVGFSGKDNGTGLGLSIARESLGRANAQITHKNTDDGSMFIIEIFREL